MTLLGELLGENKTSSQITLEYLQTRLNNINKAISDFRGQPKKEHALTVRKEIVEAEMESVINDETNSNLLRIADRELSIAREIYNQAMLFANKIELTEARLVAMREADECFSTGGTEERDQEIHKKQHYWKVLVGNKK